jgi:hypothetical protein
MTKPRSPFYLSGAVVTDLQPTSRLALIPAVDRRGPCDFCPNATGIGRGIFLGKAV